MKMYLVNFRNRKNELVKKVIVNSENDQGIIIKGKMKALENGFRFDGRKHNAGWRELQKLS